MQNPRRTNRIHPKAGPSHAAHVECYFFFVDEWKWKCVRPVWQNQTNSQFHIAASHSVCELTEWHWKMEQSLICSNFHNWMRHLCRHQAFIVGDKAKAPLWIVAFRLSSIRTFNIPNISRLTTECKTMIEWLKLNATAIVFVCFVYVHTMPCRSKNKPIDL